VEIGLPPIDWVEEDEGRRGRAAAAAGVVSIALLAACFVWAHHWGVLTGALVTAWLLAVGTTIAFAVRPARRADRKPWTRLAVACLGVSLVALMVTGVVLGAVGNIAGACGGG
jgi:peptidoglycan/LPS O-acetylase OafA/YrhL